MFGQTWCTSPEANVMIDAAVQIFVMWKERPNFCIPPKDDSHELRMGDFWNCFFFLNRSRIVVPENGVPWIAFSSPVRTFWTIFKAKISEKFLVKLYGYHYQLEVRGPINNSTKEKNHWRSYSLQWTLLRECRYRTRELTASYMWNNVRLLVVRDDHIIYCLVISLRRSYQTNPCICAYKWCASQGYMMIFRTKRKCFLLPIRKISVLSRSEYCHFTNGQSNVLRIN